MNGRGIAVAVAAACTLAGAQAAQAAGPERTVVDRFSQPYELAIDCGEFGPYGFDNLVSGRENVKVVEVVAADGTLLQTILKIRFSETGVNSESGASVALRGSVHEVWDHAEGTRTISGVVWIGHDQGAGAFVQDTGRIVLTLDTNEPLFVAGPHEAFDAGGIDALVCPALAGG